MPLIQARSMHSGQALSSELAFNEANSQGSLIIIGVIWDSSATCNVTDTNENIVYSLPVYLDSSGTSSSQIFCITRANAGVNSIGVTLSAISELGFSILEFSTFGEIYSAYDYRATGTSGTETTTSSITTTKNNSLLFSLYGNVIDLDVIIKNVDYTLATEEVFHQHATAYREVTSIQAYNSSWEHVLSTFGTLNFVVFERVSSSFLKNATKTEYKFCRERRNF